MDVSFKIDSEVMNSELKSVVEKVVRETLSDVLNTQTKVMYTRSDLAELFCVSVQSVDSHIVSKPDFPKVHIGNRVLYPHAEVMEWIKRNTVQKTIPDFMNIRNL